jgi:O-succinylbenzoic acid--CoA ligase
MGALEASFRGVLVDAWLPRAAAAHPRRPALDGLDYGALHDAALAAAGALARAGAAPGARVGIVLPAGPSFGAALHAVLLLGAVAVPVDPRLPGEEVARRTGGCAVVVDERTDLAGPPPPAGAIAGTHDLQAPAMLVHTSGTSAQARPVTLTYGNWLWSALGSATALGLDPRERWLCCLPVAHVGGLSILVRSAIYQTTALLHERFDLDRVLAALRDPAGPTLVSLVPQTLARLLDAGLSRPPALRAVLLGGAAIAPALLERAAASAVPVVATYGMTEACSQVLTGGAPLFCTRVWLGERDEVLVSGPTVSADAGPVLRTGDRGAVDPAGRLLVTGRLDDLIVSGGENVAPERVEAVLESHPGVVEAGVRGRADERWGEAVVATVVPRDAEVLDVEQLRRFCRERLAPWEVPKELTIAAALPRTASGKLRRSEL